MEIMANSNDRHAVAGRTCAVWRLFVFVPLLLCLLCTAAAAQQQATEDDVKAAYLFNFGKFVRYPAEEAHEDFEICLLGHSHIADVLERITQNESVNGRPVEVKQYEKAADARACSIVFFAASEADHIAKDLEALRGANVLTVGDTPRFLERGGMVQFVPQNSRIRFAVNPDPVSRANLRLSSELLKVAAYVGAKPVPEAAP